MLTDNADSIRSNFSWGFMVLLLVGQGSKSRLEPLATAAFGAILLLTLF